MRIALLLLAIVTAPKPVIIFPDGSALYRRPAKTVCTSHPHHPPVCVKNGKVVRKVEK
jgi:hypothetical protein